MDPSARVLTRLARARFTDHSAITGRPRHMIGHGASRGREADCALLTCGGAEHWSGSSDNCSAPYPATPAGSLRCLVWTWHFGGLPRHIRLGLIETRLSAEWALARMPDAPWSVVAGEIVVDERRLACPARQPIRAWHGRMLRPPERPSGATSDAKCGESRCASGLRSAQLSRALGHGNGGPTPLDGLDSMLLASRHPPLAASNARARAERTSFEQRTLRTPRRPAHVAMADAKRWRG